MCRWRELGGIITRRSIVANWGSGLPDFVGIQRPWAEAPRGTLGGVVDTRLIVHDTDGLVLFVDHLVGYPTGFEFTLNLRVRDRARDERVGRTFYGFARPDTPLPEGSLRFGVLFADGRLASNDAVRRYEAADGQPEPSVPFIRPWGGGGGDGRFDHDLWVWPLHAEGRLDFFAEWPDERIPYTEVEMPADALRAAALEAVQYWSAGA